jgi:hypothetical protein
MMEENLRKETLVAEENCHILALSVHDIKNTLGKSLPIILIRNQVKIMLRKEPFF